MQSVILAARVQSESRCCVVQSPLLKSYLVVKEQFTGKQVLNSWAQRGNILFLKDLPVTSVSIGISSIMHLSSNSPRSKYMAAASTKRHWRKKPTARKLVITFNEFHYMLEVTWHLGGKNTSNGLYQTFKAKRPHGWVWENSSCCRAWRNTVKVLWLVYLRTNRVQLWKKKNDMEPNRLVSRVLEILKGITSNTALDIQHLQLHLTTALSVQYVKCSLTWMRFRLCYNVSKWTHSKI